MTKLLTTQEVANVLGIAYDNARKLLKEYKPTQVIGRSNLWTWQQVEQVRTRRKR
jgi:hypothetical protein